MSAHGQSSAYSVQLSKEVVTTPLPIQVEIHLLAPYCVLRLCSETWKLLIFTLLNHRWTHKCNLRLRSETTGQLWDKRGMRLFQGGHYSFSLEFQEGESLPSEGLKQVLWT